MNARVILAGLIIVAIFTGARLAYTRIRRWHHRRWLEHFRRQKAFRPIPSHFLDGRRSVKDRFPQDHP